MFAHSTKCTKSYFVLFQYIPNEVSTKPAAKEEDKGKSWFYSNLSTEQSKLHCTFIYLFDVCLFVYIFIFFLAIQHLQLSTKEGHKQEIARKKRCPTRRFMLDYVSFYEKIIIIIVLVVIIIIVLLLIIQGAKKFNFPACPNFLKRNFPRNLGKWRVISTSPGLLDINFFVRWLSPCVNSYFSHTTGSHAKPNHTK